MSETLGEHSDFSWMAEPRLMGCLMKNGVTTHRLSHEYFVVKFDGRVKSGHRRFVDAVRAGLLLRDQFPQHDVKVHSIQVSDATEDRAALTWH